MAVPKRKTTPSRRNMRRSHDTIKLPQFQECDNCGRPRLSHHVCNFCGHYRGQQVLVPLKAKKHDDDAHAHTHETVPHVHDENCKHDH